MRLEITGLAELRARLAAVHPDEVMARAMQAEAERLAEAVRDGLSTPPGGNHDKPWTRTGALRDSIAATADGLRAAVGSNDPAAAPQEMGTSRYHPRPFLAPVAAERGPDIARALGARVAADLAGRKLEADVIAATISALHTSAVDPQSHRHPDEWGESRSAALPRLL